MAAFAKALDKRKVTDEHRRAYMQLAEQIVEPEMTAEDVETIGNAAPGQVVKLVRAMHEVNLNAPQPNARFSRPSSDAPNGEG